MSANTSRVTPFTGKIIQGKGLNLEDISTDDFNAAIQKHEMVLFRGFQCDPITFGVFASNNSGRLLLDPTRKTDHNFVQKVVIGTDAIALHSEHSNSPFAPDYIWFYCSKAARSEGQTTVANGHTIWNALKLTTQQFFCKNRIVFHRVFPEPIWKLFVASMLDENVAVCDVTSTHLDQLFKDNTNAKIVMQPDNAIKLSYAMYAFSEFDNKKYFTNSLMGPYPGQTILTESNQPIPKSILNNIENVYELQTEEIPWENGDVVVVDNRRFMHGRRQSQDMQRELFSILSYKKVDPNISH